jgi:hypothetical protein
MDHRLQISRHAGCVAPLISAPPVNDLGALRTLLNRLAQLLRLRFRGSELYQYLRMHRSALNPSRHVIFFPSAYVRPE